MPCRKLNAQHQPCFAPAPTSRHRFCGSRKWWSQRYFHSEHFKQENEKAITDHEAARAYFDEQSYGFGSGNRLPAIKELREQYAVHNTEKKNLWAKYHEVRNADKEIDNAWANVRTLLNIKDDAQIEQPEQKSPTKNAPSL